PVRRRPDEALPRWVLWLPTVRKAAHLRSRARSRNYCSRGGGAPAAQPARRCPGRPGLEEAIMAFDEARPNAMVGKIVDEFGAIASAPLAVLAVAGSRPRPRCAGRRAPVAQGRRRGRIRALPPGGADAFQPGFRGSRLKRGWLKFNQYI